ncbi:fatty-acyl-CoA synthase [Breoghania corrubedonensis]|uniref:Fatty-acyl-CoA synthase n=1 Tax=Breoghania corrubedonensis TaxID=665038 RepID=A0A2T5VFU0_9HYPH|nr:AMP-binding protein [Breoghania corrubedonensis]PTW62624.1 fatty-acyl-CoA synthase [Breoghania corrubedonensis]
MKHRLDDLLAAARGRAGSLLVTEEGGTLDAAAFDALVARAEGWLQAQGLCTGDCIALWLVNRPEWLAFLFACARRGVAIAAVNTRYRTSELEHILKSSGARMLLLAPRTGKIDFLSILSGLEDADLPDLATIALFDASDALPDILIGRPVVAVELDGILPANEKVGEPDAVSDAATEPDRPLIFFTTSGTTSAPKLVTHSEHTLALHALRSAKSYGFDAPGAAYLAAMPFCGVFGLNATLAAMAGAAPLHLVTMFDAAADAPRIRAHGLTHMVGSDEMYRRLLEVDPGCLDRARCCGFAAFTPGVGEILLEAARRGVPLRGLYGSSEVCAIFAVQDGDAVPEERVKGGGRPASHDAQVRVREVESGKLLPPGEVGELEVRAPTNFLGYFRNPKATEKAIDAEGFFRTGDMGYLRDDGSFVYLARMGDAIRLSGFLTDPAEIEEVLRAAPGVSDAQVVAVVEGGQSRPVAFAITPDPANFDADAVIADARGKLAAYKVPIRVWPLETYPTTDSANGLKIKRATLRAMAEERLKEENR